jgi:hypothetical protein
MMYKMPDDIVKAIQEMKRPTFDTPEKPDKSKCMDRQETMMPMSSTIRPSSCG